MLFAWSLTAAAATTPAAPKPAWYVPASTKVITRAVTFSDAGATLHGTLYLPELAHKVPAMVVFHGASEPLASTPFYRHLTDGLPQLGMAVLVFDRRGSGASTGEKDVVYQTLAEDGVAGANALRQMPEIDAKRVGYWGISQGGWLVTLAAVSDPKAAFGVAVSAPLMTAESQMEFAMSNRLRVIGYGQGDIDAMLDARHKLDGYFLGRDPRDAAVSALGKIAGKPWFDQMYLPAPDKVSKDPAKSSWRGEMDIDFFDRVAEVKVPIFYILGDADPWIPVAPTAEKLSALEKDHPNLSHAIVPQANHLMMTLAVDRMDDTTPAKLAEDLPQSPAYFMLLAAWLEKTALAPTTN
jgi:hypothetical protein